MTDDKRISRRSVLASVSTGTAIGLAGCLGGDGGDGGDDDVPDELEEEAPTEAGSRSDSLIPGELVHQSIEGIEVLQHWADQGESKGDFVKLEIQNNRDKALKAPSDFYSSSFVPAIRGRVLTEQGNKLSGDAWTANPLFGPGTIKAGTSAIIGLDLGPAQENAAKYELCLHPHSKVARLDGWKKACTNWTPTPTATQTR